MNKMKIIDLLNKIANGEEVPKKIKVNKIIFEYQGDDYLYKDEDKKEYWLFSAGYTDKFEWLDSALNTEVEIIEEEKKITPKDFENLGYALGSIKKYINKGYDKAIEEKKIPEKLDHLIGYDIQQFDDLKEYVEITTNDLFGKINKVIDTLNEIIDFLKSKGE